MANILPTPSIIAIKPFDALYDKNIEFLYIGSQAVENRLVITDNDTLNIVYDSTISIRKLIHTIPENTLVNGKQYIAQIQVFNIDGDSSELSDPILFYCYSTPDFFIGDIEDPYSSASIEVNVAYSQTEGETLKSYQYTLCDQNQITISSSDIFYSLGNSHTFYGLNNNTSYYIRCIGETEHGIVLDTGYKAINVSYNTIPTNIMLKLENHKCLGYISIDTNIGVIDYNVENNNYSFENGTVTLWNNSVTYNGGINVKDEFSLYIDAKKLPVKTFLKSLDDNFTLSILNVCGEYYCEFKSDNYVIYKPLTKAQISTINDEVIVDDDGNKVDVISTSYDSNESVIFELKRKNNLYSLNICYKTDGL